MVKINRTPTVPASLEKKTGDCYREADVVRQLHQDFYGKCYLCEMDKLQSIEVEHLKAHHGNKDLKYDWNNLFYSCAHCNSVKNKSEYEKNIIDCCNTEPEKMLEHTIIDGKVWVKNVVEDESALLTAKLITECFEKRNTGIRELECQVRVDELKKTMNMLYKLLDKYQKAHDERTLCAIKGVLSRKYKFAGFTRAYVRAHIETFPELSKEVELHTN